MAERNGRRTVLVVAGLSGLLGLLVLVASWFAVDTERQLRSARDAMMQWAEAELPARDEGWDDEAEFAALASGAAEQGYTLHRAPTGETLVVELPEVGFFRVHADRRDGRDVAALSPVSRPEWVADSAINSPEGN